MLNSACLSEEWFVHHTKSLCAEAPPWSHTQVCLPASQVAEKMQEPPVKLVSWDHQAGEEASSSQGLIPCWASKFCPAA